MAFFEPPAQENKYIGVPDEYFYRNPVGQLAYDPYGNPSMQYEIRTPKYSQGYQYLPANLSPDKIQELQIRLEQAGLLKSYAPGTWDATSISAYTTLLGIANAATADKEEILNRLIYVGGIQKADGADSGSGLGAPQITDDDIRALADKTAKGVLGRSLREDEVSGFIPAFRAAIAGGTSPQTAGENVIRQQTAPVEAGGYGIGGAMQVIDSLLSGGSVTGGGG